MTPHNSPIKRPHQATCKPPVQTYHEPPKRNHQVAFQKNLEMDLPGALGPQMFQNKDVVSQRILFGSAIMRQICPVYHLVIQPVFPTTRQAL